MKKIALALAAGAAMLAGSVVVSGPTGSAAHSEVVELRPAASQKPAQQAPSAPSDSKAVRETRATGRVKYWRGVPAAIKNRSGGERAHRRWRKAKSSGRQAA